MFLISTIAYDFIECITMPDQSGNLHKNPPVCRDRRIQNLQAPRNAVLPQFMTWITRWVPELLALSFRVRARFTATRLYGSLL